MEREYDGVKVVSCALRTTDKLECKLDLGEDKTFISKAFGFLDEEVHVNRVEVKDGGEFVDKTNDIRDIGKIRFELDEGSSAKVYKEEGNRVLRVIE